MGAFDDLPDENSPNALKRVTDPALLAQLNGETPPPKTPQGKSAFDELPEVASTGRGAFDEFGVPEPSLWERAKGALTRTVSRPESTSLAPQAPPAGPLSKARTVMERGVADQADVLLTGAPALPRALFVPPKPDATIMGAGLKQRQETAAADKVDPANLPDPSAPEESAWDTIVKGFQSLKGVARQAAGGVEIATGERRKRLGPLPGDAILARHGVQRSPEQMIESGWGKAIEGEKEIAKTVPNVPPGSLKAHLYGAIQSVGLNLGAIGIGAATRSPQVPLLFLGALSAGGDYYENRKEGVDQERAYIGALANGAAEYFGEKLPLDAYLKAGASQFRRVIKGALLELPGELGTQVVQSAEEKLTRNPGMTWPEFLETMQDTGIQTLMATTITGGVVGAAGKTVEAIKGKKEGGIEPTRAPEGATSEEARVPVPSEPASSPAAAQLAPETAQSVGPAPVAAPTASPVAIQAKATSPLSKKPGAIVAPRVALEGEFRPEAPTSASEDLGEGVPPSERSAIRQRDLFDLLLDDDLEGKGDAEVVPMNVDQASEPQGGRDTTEPSPQAPRRLLEGESGFLHVSFLKPVADMTIDLEDAYKRPPESTPFIRNIGKFTGTLQQVDQKLTRAAKEINIKIPKNRQVAITHYMQAGGDEALLRQRTATVRKEHRKGFEDALTLTVEEKKQAVAFRKRLDDVWEMASKAGILETYVENYVRGEWDPSGRAARRLYAQANAGLLNTKPREGMKKAFDSYFDGIQAGFAPKDMRIGRQAVAAERSILQAIEARKFLRNLTTSKEKDGRPTVIVGGSGRIVGKAEGTHKASLVLPNIKPKDADPRDYRFLDHPALRKWKWVGGDAEGKPILLEGNMWIHPDAYSRLNAILGKSKIKEYTIPEKVPVIGGTRPGMVALRAGAFIKGTILLGPFHQFHVGEHALFHKVSPFNQPEIDFDKRPLLREGVEHGLMLFNHNAMEEFGEGLATGGLFHRIPVAGDLLRWYQEWLFQGYIPRLKATMFEHAVKRAEGYYEKDLKDGKLTRDQLLDNAAKQANAAFGEQNYKYIGRNPTFQDALRIGLLAPDFLEARLKFAGQAARPYGREQLYALIRGAILMGLTAQVINFLFGDDRKFHWDKPFTVIIGGREYTPRSVVADIGHLFANPRSFWYHRLNPLWGRPLYEIGTGRNFYGRKVGFEEAAEDVLKSWIPIPFQGVVKENTGDSFVGSVINSLLQSIGLTNYEYRSRAAQLTYEYLPRMEREGVTREQRRIARLKNRTLDMLRKGKTWGELPDSMREELSVLSDKELRKIDREAADTLQKTHFKRLSIEHKIAVWKVATFEERMDLMRTYKAAVRKRTGELRGEERLKFKEMIQEAE